MDAALPLKDEDRSMTRTTPFAMKTLLSLDALTCAAMGGALIAGSGLVSAITDIPAALLHWAGLSLLPIAAFMAIAALASGPRWMVTFIILGNGLWVAASLILPAGGLIVPNALGWTFLVGQAAVVAVLAKLEFEASRDSLELSAS